MTACVHVYWCMCHMIDVYVYIHIGIYVYMCVCVHACLRHELFPPAFPRNGLIVLPDIHKCDQLKVSHQVVCGPLVALVVPQDKVSFSQSEKLVISGSAWGCCVIISCCGAWSCEASAWYKYTRTSCLYDRTVWE